MECYAYLCMVCTDVNIYNVCLYTLYYYHTAQSAYADDQTAKIHVVN